METQSLKDGSAVVAGSTSGIGLALDQRAIRSRTESTPDVFTITLVKSAAVFVVIG